MKLKSGLYLSIVVLAVMLALSACGNNNNSNNSSSPSASAPVESAAASSEEAVAEGQTIEVTVDATNWEFDVKEIKAKVGDTLKLTFTSSDGNHGIGIDELGDLSVKKGETVEIKLDKAGTFEYYCDIMCGQGHDNMTGNIIVV